MNTYRIVGIDALVTKFNPDTKDWSGNSWSKSNDMVATFNCDKLTIGQLTKVVNSSFGFEVNYVDTYNNNLTVSITEDINGNASDDGTYLVDYTFKVELITIFDLGEIDE